MAGDSYSIADIAIWPWYGNLMFNALYDASQFLDTGSYKNLNRWAKAIGERPAVLRGKRVNKTWGPEEEQVPERHDASDIS